MTENNAKKKLKNPEISVSTKELAKLLGLSSRRIQQLTKIIILKPDSYGKYPLFKSFRAYLNYLRNLLRRYMRSLKIEVERAERRTNFKKLPFYQDLNSRLTPFSKDAVKAVDDRLQKLFKSQSQKETK